MLLTVGFVVFSYWPQLWLLVCGSPNRFIHQNQCGPDVLCTYNLHSELDANSHQWCMAVFLAGSEWLTKSISAECPRINLFADTITWNSAKIVFWLAALMSQDKMKEAWWLHWYNNVTVPIYPARDQLVKLTCIWWNVKKIHVEGCVCVFAVMLFLPQLSIVPEFQFK